MAECKDFQIISALITQLEKITTANGYETQVNRVFIPKKKLNFDTYPAIAVFIDENNPVEGGFSQEQGTIYIALLYTDGKNDDNDDVDAYTYRYRNVGADIKKCLNANIGLDGLCENIKIASSGSQTVLLSKEIIEAHFTFLEITRLVNMYNPYL